MKYIMIQCKNLPCHVVNVCKHQQPCENMMMADDCFLNYRLHQPVKNPISDNSNILWNSPYLEINSKYRLP